jgi:predicted nucleotidyltransferase
MAEVRENATLGSVREHLLPHAAELHARGIHQLYAYGSVARGEDRPDSDLDLFAELTPEARWSIVTLASVADRLREVLGRPVDFSDLETLRPAIRERAGRDAVPLLP